MCLAYQMLLPLSRPVETHAASFAEQRFCRRGRRLRRATLRRRGRRPRTTAAGGSTRRRRPHVAGPARQAPPRPRRMELRRVLVEVPVRAVERVFVFAARADHPRCAGPTTPGRLPGLPATRRRRSQQPGPARRAPPRPRVRMELRRVFVKVQVRAVERVFEGAARADHPGRPWRCGSRHHPPCRDEAEKVSPAG